MMIIFPRKSVAFILFEEHFYNLERQPHNLDADQIPLEKIKLLIELKFMEKGAKTVKWVLDKVTFLFACL